MNGSPKKKKMYAKEDVKEDDDDLYLDPILYVIEWNEANLTARNLMKANIITRM
jgi:hypothetical protein